jgi:hypothetical protein
MKGTRSGQQATVSASARESIAGIWQLQVSDNITGLKMGESAPGASIIKQTFTLAPGTHQIAVGDISTRDLPRVACSECLHPSSADTSGSLAHPFAIFSEKGGTAVNQIHPPFTKASQDRNIFRNRLIAQ